MMPTTRLLTFVAASRAKKILATAHRRNDVRQSEHINDLLLLKTSTEFEHRLNSQISATIPPIIKMPVPVPSAASGEAPTSQTSTSATANTTHEVQNSSTQSVASANQQQKSNEKSDAEFEADRLYEERIEEEYAKREGGA